MTSAEPKKQVTTHHLKATSELYEVLSVFSSSDFPMKKVKIFKTGEIKVVRFQEGASLTPAFKALYDKELKYYRELSDLIQVKEGWVYSRTFFEGESLKDFSQRYKYYKKNKFSDFSSKDLKLILNVWKEINLLSVTHNNLNERNILVQPHLGWFSNEPKVKLVDFTTEDCSEQKMRADVHGIFSRLLGKETYDIICNKYMVTQ